MRKKQRRLIRNLVYGRFQTNLLTTGGDTERRSGEARSRSPRDRRRRGESSHRRRRSAHSRSRTPEARGSRALEERDEAEASRKVIRPRTPPRPPPGWTEDRDRGGRRPVELVAAQRPTFQPYEEPDDSERGKNKGKKKVETQKYFKEFVAERRAEKKKSREEAGRRK